MTPPAATAAGRTIPRTAAPRRPRRVSGPARPASRTARPRPADPFALRAVGRVIACADSRFLRRLIDGRLWVPLVAAGLMGIVFMQVSMLKLNAGIGRAVQSASTLERQNATMRAEVSRMESGERIDDVAHQLGMVVPADGGEHYVNVAGAADAARAVHRMTVPDTQAVARTQQAAAAATTAAVTPAATPAAAGAAVAAPVVQQQQQQPVTPTPTPA